MSITRAQIENAFSHCRTTQQRRRETLCYVAEMNATLRERQARYDEIIMCCETNDDFVADVCDALNVA